MVLDAALNNWTAVKQLLVNLQESINNQNWFLPNLFQQDVDQWKAVSVANEVLLRVIKARRAQFLQQKTVVQLDFDKSPCLASFRKQ
jgi:hypothetical protein